MTVFTNLGVNIAAPTDAGGNPRKVDNGQMQVWMTEVEYLSDIAFTNSIVNSTRVDALTEQVDSINIDGTLAKTTLSELDTLATDLALGAGDEGRVGRVFDDGSNTGYYTWTGSAWVFEGVDEFTALDDRVDRVDGNAETILATIVTRQQVVGVEAPATGTNAAGATYVLARAVEGGGLLRSLDIFCMVAATIEVGVFTRSTSDVFTRVQTVTKSVVPGLQTLTLDLAVNGGDYLGVTSATTGWASYLSETNPGYFLGTLAGGAFTDATVTTGTEIQVSFTIDIFEDKLRSNLLADELTTAQFVGTQAEPVTGANSAQGTLVLGDAAKSDGVIQTVDIWAGTSATVNICLFERSGITLTRVAVLRRVTLLAGGLNTIALSAPIQKGQYVGFQSVFTGWCVNTAETSVGYWYVSNAAATSFDDAALGTTNQMQIRVHVARLATGGLHAPSLATVDRIVGVGPSYMAGYYNPRGKNWLSKVSLFSPYNFDSIAAGGAEVSTEITYIRDNIAINGTGLGYQDMAPAYTLINIGYNDAVGGDSVPFATYVANLRQLIEIVRGCGSIPILASEWKPVYDASAHVMFKTLAEEWGILFLDMIPHTLKMNDGTPYGDFWQAAGTIDHPGVRTNHIITDQTERFLAAHLPRPKNAIKAFRKRSEVTVLDINDELMFRNEYERAERFREIFMSQHALVEGDEDFYDTLSNSGLYTFEAVASEYLTWQAGGTVAFDDYSVVSVTIDATSKNVQRFTLGISDPDVAVYVRSSLGFTLPAAPSSACEWVELTGDDGLYEMDGTAIRGRMDFDTLHFLLYKSGGFSISEPSITWFGEAGKPEFARIAPKERAQGTELLNVTKFAAISGDKATGWDDQGGTLTPDTDDTYQLPYDIAAFVTVDGTVKAIQTLDYVADNFHNIEIEIRVTARVFPDREASGGTYPDDYPINQDSFDWRQIAVELIDATGTFSFERTVKVGLWWDDVVIRSTLPMRVAPLDIRVSGKDGAVQIGEVSVKKIL